MNLLWDEDVVLGLPGCDETATERHTLKKKPKPKTRKTKTTQKHQHLSSLERNP